MDIDADNGLTVISETPSIEDIQQTLVNINDKPESFLNSTDWLGALEVNRVIEFHFTKRAKWLILFFLLNAGFLCDWHTVWYIMSNSAHSKLSRHSKVLEYHKVLFGKFRRPYHDGRWFGCFVEMHCWHSYCSEWCVLTDCGKYLRAAFPQANPTKNMCTFCQFATVVFCCCTLWFSFALLVHFFYHSNVAARDRDLMIDFLWGFM